jgi:chaperonin GroES
MATKLKTTEALTIAAELRSMGPHKTGYELIGERVLVLQDEGQDKTPGGIIIPDTAKQVVMRGTIVMLGAGVRQLQASENPVEAARYAGLAIGKRLTFNRWNLNLQKLARANGDEVLLLVLHAGDVYLVWSEE